MAATANTTQAKDQGIWVPSVSVLVKRKPVAVALAAALFAAILALRFAADTTGDGVSFLYLIPIVIVAITFGPWGGVLAASVAFVLASGWALLEGANLTLVGYLVRAAVFLMIGDMVGRFATSLRTIETASARHLELSQDMICTADFNGYFTRVNPAFERILGFSEADLLGRPFLEFVHPEDRERTEAEAAALAEGAKTIHFQNRYFDSSGEIHWLEWMSQPVPEEEIIYAVARDITERKALERELQRLSQHDSLTGLFNRRRFEEELRRQLAYTRRYGSGGALLIIDLDRFKEINDTLGHAAGDRALCQVAALLRDNLRGTDVMARDSAESAGGCGTPVRAAADAVVARLGGDEFVVLLPEVDEDGARATAERLAETVRSTTLNVDRHEVRLGISVGIALFDEYGRPGEQDLLAAADRAMYRVKAAGGGGANLALPPA